MPHAADLFKQGHFAEAAKAFESLARSASCPEDALRFWSNAAAAHMQGRDFDSAIIASTMGLEERVDNCIFNTMLQLKCRLRRAQSLLAVAEGRGIQCAEAAEYEAAFCCGTATQTDGDMSKRAIQVQIDAQSLIRRSKAEKSSAIPHNAMEGLHESSTGAGELLTAAHSLRLQCRLEERPQDTALYMTVSCANEFGLFSEELFASRIAAAECDATSGHLISVEATSWEGLPPQLWRSIGSEQPPLLLGSASSISSSALEMWKNKDLTVLPDAVSAALHGNVRPIRAPALDKHGRAFISIRTPPVSADWGDAQWLAPVCLRLRLAAGGDVAAPVLSPPLAWCMHTGQLKPLPVGCMQHLLQGRGRTMDVAAAATSACSRLFQIGLQSGTPECADEATATCPMSIALSEHFGDLGIAGRNWDAGIATSCILAGLVARGGLLNPPPVGTTPSGMHTVIELGAGTGLTGITLASTWRALSAQGRPMPPLQVLLTDVSPAVPAMDFNLLLNGFHSAGHSSAQVPPARISVRSGALFWGRDTVDRLLQHDEESTPGSGGQCAATVPKSLRFNTIVLMTDVVYDEEVYAGLVSACCDACGLPAAAAYEDGRELAGGGTAEPKRGNTNDVDTPPAHALPSTLPGLPPLLSTVFAALRQASKASEHHLELEAQRAVQSLVQGIEQAPQHSCVPFILLGYRPRHESAVEWWSKMLQSFHAVRIWHAAPAEVPGEPAHGAAATTSATSQPPALPHSLVLDLPWVCRRASAAEGPFSSALHLPAWCDMIVSRGSDLSLFVLFPRFGETQRCI